MAISLDQIVPWGRTRGEYECMFKLELAAVSRGTLDCGGGPSSFTAELASSGLHAVSVDPIYAFSGAEIQARFAAMVEPMMTQVRTTPEDWCWRYHRDPDDLCAHRRAALDRFLIDYEEGKRQRRYITGELPVLPFASDSFGLAVCSHLLFLYSELLSEAFHIQSILEMGRVAREVRIFPLLTLRHEPSGHLPTVQAAVQAQGWTSEVVKVDYELQRGGNRMLRIFRA